MYKYSCRNAAISEIRASNALYSSRTQDSAPFLFLTPKSQEIYRSIAKTQQDMMCLLCNFSIIGFCFSYIISCTRNNRFKKRSYINTVSACKALCTCANQIRTKTRASNALHWICILYMYSYINAALLKRTSIFSGFNCSNPIK